LKEEQMGSKTTVETDSTRTAAPPSWTMPGISNAADKVTSALNQLPGVKYTGDFVAAPNQGLVDQAQGAYGTAASHSTDLGNYVEQQIKQDPSAAIAALTHPIMQQLTQQILPGIKSSSLDSGAYSGDRAMSVMPTQAIGQSMESAQRVAEQYGIDRLKMLPDLTNNAMQLHTGAGDIYEGMNQLDTATRQSKINNDLAKNQYDWQYPFQGLDIASSLLAQLSGNYGTTTEKGTQTTSTGGAGAIASGILGAASLASSFIPGVGAVAGPALGAVSKNIGGKTG
jgi:hypothetical protein